MLFGRCLKLRVSRALVSSVVCNRVCADFVGFGFGIYGMGEMWWVLWWCDISRKNCVG